MEAHTWTTLAINSAKVTGVALIGTKIDIPTAIFFLVFFSFIHALVVLHYARKSPTTDMDFIDFAILVVIALGSGILFMIFGIMSGSDELKIYMFGIFGSLLWVKGITTFIDFFSSKLGIEVKENETWRKK